jgi:hypothetical protein
VTATLAPLRRQGRTAPPELLDPPAPPGSSERLAVWLLAAAFVFQPMLRPAGPGNSSPVDLLTVAAILAGLVWACSSHRKLRAPYVLPVAISTVAGLASAIVGPLPSVAALSIVIDLLLLFWCLTVVNVAGRPHALRTVLRAWCLSGVFWAVVVTVAQAGHVTALEGLTAADGNRVLFTFGDPNYAAAYWVNTILVVYATRVPERRWLRFVGYGFLVWALLLTESNGGALALGVAIIFLLAVRSYKRRGWLGPITVILLVGSAAGGFLTAVPVSSIRTFALDSNVPLLVNSIGRSNQSSSQRGELLHESFQLYGRSEAVLGLGPATTKPLLTEWQYPYAKEAHDDYVASLVERGLLGAIGLLLLVGSIASRAAPVVSRGLSPPFAAAVPRPAGIVAAAVALAVSGAYYQILHFRFAWAIFAFVAVLGRDGRARPKEVAR